MNLQTISFNFNFKNSPEADTTVNLIYEHYYGCSRGFDSEDPGEIAILSGMKNLTPMTDAEIEEVRTKAEYEIVTELKADREDAMYHNWKGRNE